MGNLTTREEAALRDPDVKFGYDNYEMLKQVGELVQQMRAETSMSQAALHAASGVDQGDISRLESGALERGPTLLTLVKLAHAAGKRLGHRHRRCRAFQRPDHAPAALLTVTLETLSDISGLLSGICLLITAWRNDGLFGFIDRMRQVVDEARKQGVADAKTDKVLDDGLQAELSRWTWLDRWSLRLGATMLVFAFVLKMIHTACSC